MDGWQQDNSRFAYCLVGVINGHLVADNLQTHKRVCLYHGCDMLTQPPDLTVFEQKKCGHISQIIKAPWSAICPSIQGGGQR